MMDWDVTHLGGSNRMMSLNIQLLGQPRIFRDDKPVVLPGYRPLALLAYLVVTQKEFSRQHLIDLLFDNPDDPRAALRWTLSKLRKSIGSDKILANTDGVSFNFQSDYWLDVVDFEAGNLELYQGDFLEGLYLRDAPRFDDWLIFERQRLRGINQTNLERQLDGYKQQGNHAAVIITTQELLKLDHLREDWHFDLIYAYAQLGRRAAALEQYEKCSQILQTELGSTPDIELKTLIETIRSGFNGATSTPVDRHAPSTSIIPITGKIPIEQPSSPDTRPRHIKSKFVWVAIGTIGLFIGMFILLNLIFSDRGMAMINDIVDLSPTNSAGITGALRQELVGKTVWIMAPFSDKKAEMFIQSMKPFEEQSGIDIEFITGSEVDFNGRLETGNLPDIVLFSQPGRLVDLAKQGKMIDLGIFLEDEYLNEQYPELFLDLAARDGKVLGVWYRAGLKSLVWYPKQAFLARGYREPETWEELIALSDQIVADGSVPWCIGIDDHEAKGWVGTDWVEDILLRTAPPETYDAWVNHDLPYNSPEIHHVFEIMGQIWLNDEYIYGGIKNIAEESFLESPDHLFDDPPGCFLHRQASFAPMIFPTGVRYGQDYDFFYLPPIDSKYGKPVLGSGDIFAMFNDRPEVRETIRYLTTTESVKLMIEAGGFLSPHKATPIEWFQMAADLRYAEIILSADTYRFDGSDLMPEVVGFGSFYRGISDWVEGADVETVLQMIDDSWPR
jgi:alpha-glucoside transport system substrate-binding protein